MIEPDVAELLTSPCSLLVGSVGPDGMPDATRGWSAEVLGADRVRVLLPSNETRMLANLGAGCPMALTATDFVTFVSWQLKGHVTTIEPMTAADRIRLDAYAAGCVRILHETEGTPEEIIWRIFPVAFVACELEVEQVFDQTPGPHAGARVAPSAS